MASTHRLKAVGKLIVQMVSNLASVTYNSTYDKGRLIYDQTTGHLYFGSGQTSSFRSLYDIPLNTTVLFEANTARLGYTLLTGTGDRLVYITKGSAEGGDPGAQTKTDSTWNQTAHVHSMFGHDHRVPHSHTMNHTHTSSNHNHKWHDFVSTAAAYSWNSSFVQIPYANGGLINAVGMCVNSQNDGSNHLDCALGDFWTSIANAGVDSYLGSTITIDPYSLGPSVPDTTSVREDITWRPVGVNYTRQRRV